MSIYQLNQSITACQACPFYKTLNYGCFPTSGCGNRQAKLLLINLRATQEAHLVESPVGTRNQLLLTKLLETINLTINDVYITNMVKCAGPVTPKKTFIENAKTCIDTFLLKEINEIQPLSIVCFGVGIPKILFTDKKATIESTYTLPTISNIFVTHSLEELFIKGDTIFQEAIETLKKAKLCAGL